MRTFSIETAVKVYAYQELSADELQLAEGAMEATRRSYSPYSKFCVGAAVLLANGEVLTGSNQENAAYPSGLCAERTVLFYANSRFPEVPVVALAIAARAEDADTVTDICPPCGACRQVLLEAEQRFGHPIKVLLCGANEVFVVENVASLLPLSFGNEHLM